MYLWRGVYIDRGQNSFPYSVTRTTVARMITKQLIVTIIIVGHAATQQALLFESFMRLTAVGTLFQPQHSIEWLRTMSNVRSVFHCAKQSNQNRLCRTFDLRPIVARLPSLRRRSLDRDDLDQRYLVIIESRLRRVHGWSLCVVQWNMWSVQWCEQSVPSVSEQCLSMPSEYLLGWSDVFESIIEWIDL
jgi:hypothetical protein